MQCSLIGSPHLMQGISAVAWRRVHVGVGLIDCSIVSSVSMGRRNATHSKPNHYARFLP